MKKLTEDKIIKKSKETLLVFLVLVAIFFWLASQRNFSTIEWWITGGVFTLMVATEVYPSTRLLYDSAYRRRHLIARNDERNLAVENMAYRKLVHVIFYTYLFIAGLVIGYFSDSLTNEQTGWLTLAFLAFALFGLLAYLVTKWYYQHQL